LPTAAGCMEAEAPPARGWRICAGMGDLVAHPARMLFSKAGAVAFATGRQRSPPCISIGEP